MTPVLATLAAILVSLAGILLLAASDPKRRRVFGLPEARRRPVTLACLCLAAPGAALLIAGQSAAFVMWLAAVPLVGWALSAFSPTEVARIGSGLTSAARALFRRSSGAQKL
jgi:hypothetical protein